MARYCPPWCVPTHHDHQLNSHRSAPVEIVTPADRFFVHLEAGDGRLPYVLLTHFAEPMDAEDVPTFDPDNLLLLPLPVAAELVAAIVSLIARDLPGGDHS
ncbi:hypothetical protein [Verrucosispora sp. WMMD1129]|uniref:hypothetical protein n=1 Tax=Verrucosispora sp. WMMD1129 TaxID=3016093 RepID=UPI00249BDE4B|nr:hypothetical protein [Verrucosispora sp. WMMD1129]WFE44995.1 hypothetical protein O7624_11930 [Verrucosispora sp. WMMD1129]WFE46295.1 hypothetical protein O7624_19055 [Verrucosispora sp. WMMD1129]